MFKNNSFKFNISYPHRLIFQTSDGAYPKDPKAAALVSGDIDKVFATFGLEPGFLNRKQFLIKHPEIIEYINAKIGETRIQPNAEGYRGTSAENGAYIEFFKEHIGDIENMTHGSEIQELAPSAAGPAVETSTMPVQPVLQETPANAVQEPSVNPILPVQEIQSINDNQEQIITQEQEIGQIPSELEPPQESLIQPTTQILQSQSISDETSDIIQHEPSTGLLGSQPTPISNEPPLSESAIRENQPQYVFSSTPHEPPTSTEETEPKAQSSEPPISAEADDLMAPYQADVENDEEIHSDEKAQHVENEIEPAHEEVKTLGSLYDLEELSWWPMEDIKLQIKDAKNGIMSAIQGAGLVKRSILYAITLLENGNIWLFTDDPTVPQEDRDQVLDFEEFKALIERSF